MVQSLLDNMKCYNPDILIIMNYLFSNKTTKLVLISRLFMSYLIDPIVISTEHGIGSSPAVFRIRLYIHLDCIIQNKPATTAQHHESRRHPTM